MAAALYCRVSTDEQAEHGYSIGHQRDRLLAFCQSQGWTEHRLYVDEGYSGTNLNRPALQEMIRDIQAGLVSVVIVLKLDRLGRRQHDVLHLLEDVFETHNVAFRSATEPFDTATPLGKAMLGVLAVFAQLERDTIIERLTAGRRQRVKMGFWHGGRDPFGYVHDPATKGLRMVPNQARIVRELFQRYLQGHSLSALAEWMSALTPDRAVDHTAIRGMLQRKTYCGLLYSGNQLVEARFEPIIDRETFDRVQAELERRREGKSPIGAHLLSGLLRCGLCGASVMHVQSRAKRRGRVVTYHYYACKHQHHRPNSADPPRPKCTLGYLPQGELDQWVLEQVQRIALDPGAVAQQARMASREASESAALLADLQAQVKAAEMKLDRWYTVFESGEMDRAVCIERIDQLQQSKAAMEAQCREIQRIAAEPLWEGATAVSPQTLVQRAWPYLSDTQRESVVRAAFEQIIVYPKGRDPEITWRS